MDKKDEYLFQCMKVWLYDRLNGGQMDVNIPMEQFIAEFQLRFIVACNQYVDVDMLHVNRTLNEVSKEKPNRPVPSTTSSPILEHLVKKATPEALQSAKYRMVQDVIDNMVDNHRDKLSHLSLPDSPVGNNLIGYRQGLNDMFHYLEELIEPES